MQVSVVESSPLERRLTITVPYERVDEAYNNRISKLSKTSKMNGFRKGKVPSDVIKKRYGESVRQEALSEVIQKSLYEAIAQEKLHPVGVPVMQPNVIVAGQPLEYTATFEVMPQIQNVSFELAQLEKPVATVTTADIDKVIERLCEQHATWKAVNYPAQDKNRVTIDFVGSIDHRPFEQGTANNYSIVLGSKTMIPGFEEGLMGVQAKDERTIKINFPTDYFSKEVAGKEAEFAITVHEVAEANLPELNETFIKKLGIKSGMLADLRAEIKNNLDRELVRVIKQQVKTQIFEKLLEQNPIQIPQALIEREAKRLHDEIHPHHSKDHHHTPEEMNVFNESAKKHVAIGLMVSELVKKYQISVNKDQVQTQIASIAAAFEKPEEVKNWYMRDPKRLAEVEMQILEDQVIEKLLENVKVTEKVISYTELMSTLR